MGEEQKADKDYDEELRRIDGVLGVFDERDALRKHVDKLVAALETKTDEEVKLREALRVAEAQLDHAAEEILNVLDVLADPKMSRTDSTRIAAAIRRLNKLLPLGSSR